MQSNDIRFIKLNEVTSILYANTTLNKPMNNNSETMLNKQIDQDSKTLSDISLPRKNEMISFTAAMNSINPAVSITYDDVFICPDWLSLDSENWIFFGPKSSINNRNNSNIQMKSIYHSYSNVSFTSDTRSRSSSGSDNLSGSGRISI